MNKESSQDRGSNDDEPESLSSLLIDIENTIVKKVITYAFKSAKLEIHNHISAYLDHGVELITKMVYLLITVIIILIASLFLSTAIAHWLNSIFQDDYVGYLIVATAYLISTFFLKITLHRLIQRYLLSKSIIRRDKSKL
ncbi:hypothetical protein [uncultured Pseudoteredinibacter sp.]|uniref:hypothetical protein n=1 Tax=uncultured Pseudoteredinibacter sp. TaxID=1641701 RepID=UPI0026097A6A|nr:hypothetical protein [uncultured Pseudoteredinibacter sp.]